MKSFFYTIILIFCVSNLCQAQQRQGTLIDGNKSYTGQILDKKPHGEGTLTIKGISVFNGVFNNGKKISGTITFTSGDKIIHCVFEKDQLIQGEYIFASGAKYTGSFKTDKFDGEGIYYYTATNDKLKYEGQFSNGMYNGNGKLTYKNGTIQDGEWKDDEFLSYVAIALLDPDGAKGLGHAGLLLGDFSNGYLYYSNADEGNQKYSNASKYLNCQETISELNRYNNYSKAFILYINQKAFKKMNTAASITVNREYDLTSMHLNLSSNNCLDLLINALEAGGFNTGIIEARNSVKIPVPNIRFNIIQEKNAGKSLSIQQLCDIINENNEKKLSLPKRNY
jgi:hypothetical protein